VDSRTGLDVVARRKKIPSLPLPEIGPWRPVLSLVTTLTEISRIPDKKKKLR